jgi:putative membrane protein insertion efficiency factor
MRFRRRDRYYPPQSDYRYRDRRGGGGGSCLRDTCLIETGCCIGEALDGNCLLLGVMLLPRMLMTMATAPRRTSSPEGPLVGAIHTYQERISAKRETPCCRFTPSCSHYAAEAITTHGTIRGVFLAAGRLARCRPGGRRGPDPVPARKPRAGASV